MSRLRKYEAPRDQWGQGPDGGHEVDIGYVRFLLYMIVLDDQKFNFALKLLRLGSKDLWKQVSGDLGEFYKYVMC